MKLSGTAELSGSAAEAFDRLLDPAVLARCIPGCERLEEVGPGRYEVVLRAGVGPAKGRFAGTIVLSDIERPSGYSITVNGMSTVGHVQGGARVRLEATQEGTTAIHYEGEGRVSGLLASVGARLIDAAAKQVARKFFELLAEEAASTG